MKHITKSILYSLTVAAMATSLSSCKGQKPVEKKPMNIVYIMCDDHSFQTISAYDRRYIQTPNIDRISNEGARFTNSFVANSLSGPSRACMLTLYKRSNKRNANYSNTQNRKKLFDRFQLITPRHTVQYTIYIILYCKNLFNTKCKKNLF